MAVLKSGGRSALAVVNDNDFDLDHTIDPVGHPDAIRTQVDFLPLPAACS